eukprot:5522830-Pleurochrysis_carterae.AAC.1
MSSRRAERPSEGGASETLKLRGMPFHSTEADVAAFFKGCALARARGVASATNARCGAGEDASSAAASSHAQEPSRPPPPRRFRLRARARLYAVASGGIKLGPQGGHGTVRFGSADEARRALLCLNHSYMGSRYIELFST